MSDDPNSPQVLARWLTQQEAAMLVSHLESLGIKADIWGDNAAIAWPEVPRDIQVVVRSTDLDRAKEELDLIRRDQSKGATDQA
jgi:hypothetical protein